MYIENCTCPVATHVSRQMDNVTWHVNCASETDSQTSVTLRLECIWTVNTATQVLAMKIIETKNFFEGRGMRKYFRDKGEKSP